jgi:DNA polymerase I-like protein with 3'-5' exonuclease and polymerase domains
MTKKAMVDCYQSGYMPLLQVHDELVFSVASDKDVAGITETMEQAVSLCVPNKVDAEVGKNWGDSMESQNDND